MIIHITILLPLRKISAWPTDGVATYGRPGTQVAATSAAGNWTKAAITVEGQPGAACPIARKDRKAVGCGHECETWTRAPAAIAVDEAARRGYLKTFKASSMIKYGINRDGKDDRRHIKRRRS